MKNIFLEKGNISDMISFMKSDLLDTYNNQLTVLNNILDHEADILEPFQPQYFALDGFQYVLEFNVDTNNYEVYFADTSKTLAQVINPLVDDNVGIWPSIDQLEQDISDACDSTYTMLTAVNTVDVDDLSQPVLNNFTAAVNTWMPSAKSEAHNAFSSMVDALATGSDSGATIISWISSQYQAFTSGSANDNTGAFEFADDKYHVQGFFGQYVAKVAFEVVSTVISTVLTVIQPIIGIVVGGIAMGIKALLGFVGEFTDSNIKCSEANNTAFAQPIFQNEWALNSISGILDSSDNVDNINIYQSLLLNKVLTCRVPGWTFRLCLLEPDSIVRFEAFINFDYMTYKDQYKYCFLYNPGYDAFQQTPAPYTGYVKGFVLNGRSLTVTDKPTSDYFNDLLYNLADQMSSNTVEGLVEQVNADVLTTNEYSQSAMMGYIDNLALSNLHLALYYFGAYLAANNLSISSISPTMTYPSDGATLQDWVNYLCVYPQAADTTVTWTWEKAVNKVIPRLRKFCSQTWYPLTFMMFMLSRCKAVAIGSAYSSLTSTLSLITNDIAPMRKCRWIPPKYSTTAKITSLAILAGIAVATAAIAITTVKIKTHLKKKQIRKYRDVQANWNSYMEDPSEENLRAYRKSIRKYNKFSKLTGSSRLSGISGWETGEDSSTASLPASFNGVINSADRSIENNDADSISLVTIRRLLSGQ